MRRDPLFLLWTVRCPSPEDCRRLQSWLAPLVAPEATFVDEVRVFTEEGEATRREPHRLGEYFESVQVLSAGESSPAAFRLVFRRRAEASRFWKDMMVRLLQKVRDEAAGTTTTLDYQGDEEPANHHLRTRAVADDPTVHDFGDSDAVLSYIRERSEDLQRVVIPQSPYLTLTKGGVPQRNVVVGMVLHFISGDRQFITPTDAQVILNDGILNRMKVRIELMNQMEGHGTPS